MHGSQIASVSCSAAADISLPRAWKPLDWPPAYTMKRSCNSKVLLAAGIAYASAFSATPALNGIRVKSVVCSLRQIPPALSLILVTTSLDPVSNAERRQRV